MWLTPDLACHAPRSSPKSPNMQLIYRILSNNHLTCKCHAYYKTDYSLNFYKLKYIWNVYPNFEKTETTGISGILETIYYNGSYSLLSSKRKLQRLEISN